MTVSFVILAASIPMNEDRDRVLTPMVRKDGALKAATWDDALAVISEKAKVLQGKNCRRCLNPIIPGSPGHFQSGLQ